MRNSDKVNELSDSDKKIPELFVTLKKYRTFAAA